MYSWLRRSLSRNNKDETQNLNTPKPSKIEDEEYYGVTNHLIEFIKTFTLDTFNGFPLLDEQNDGIETTLSGVRVDLSEWQQHHATMILSKVKELSQLRYTLCPRHLKERQFWRIYFTLVKPHLTEYELRAIRLDKLRKMAAEDDTMPSDTNGIELEMTEPKNTSKLTSP
ncbi:hypothetical protein RND81_05G221300 [Saponaria officinalis]|uniref:BSD domain-containing protein n=1 Tax=Saponaria officinalis TaxID=3572 RepID=A0AAW1L311_SAPOF